MKLPRLSQIPNLQNYELIPSGSRIFYMYHTMMTLVTVLVCLHIFLQTELLGRQECFFSSFILRAQYKRFNEGSSKK